MKKWILKNKYLILPTLFILTVATSFSVSFTIAKYTKTVDVGTILLDFSKENPTEQSAEAFDGSYTVQIGDTLSEIAKRYSTTVEKLQAYNDIEGTLIIEGQKISIPPQDYVIPQSESTESQEMTPSESNSVSEPTDTSATEPFAEGKSLQGVLDGDGTA